MKKKMLRILPITLMGVLIGIALGLSTTPQMSYAERTATGVCIAPWIDCGYATCPEKARNGICFIKGVKCIDFFGNITINQDCSNSFWF